MKKSKYFNKKITIDGIEFDSQKEGRRYSELRIKQKAGEIGDITVHPLFTIQEGFTINKKKIRPISYEADFKYKNNSDGKTYIEDTKGFRTEVYKIKMKLLLYILKTEPDTIFVEL